MKLMVASYNNGGSAWNAEAEETSFIDYRLMPRFNEPAEAFITLADATGAIAQKYNADANDVYLGVGKVTIEDPTGTDIFYGRILKATANTESRTVELYCQDWLSQLDEEQITYEMREDLDGAGLRQSVVFPDYDNADTLGIRPAHLNLAVLAGFVTKDSDEEVDDTVDANDAGASDVGMLSKIGEAIAVGNSANFGFTNRVGGVRCNIGMAGTGNYTLIWYYSKGADSWGVLTVTDGTGSFKVAGTNDVTWTPPSDWATDEVGAITCLWVRATMATGTAPLTEARGTQFWAIENLVYDHEMSWDANEWNDKYMVLSDEMAGAITVKTGPYDKTVTPSAAPMTVDAFTHDIGDLWTVDADTHTTADGDDFTVDYKFHIWVPDSAFHSSTVLEDVKIHIYYEGGSSVSTIELYNGVDYDIIASADTPGTDPVWQTVKIPDDLIVSSLDANGDVIVRFNESNATGGGFIIHYLMVEYIFTTTGYSSAISIYDTTANRLIVGTDLSADATRVWHGVPYAIAKKIYLHIESATGPVLGGDVMVTLTCGDANVENTSGISTRRYENQTRLAIMQDLARQDKAEFWVGLGGTTVTWKSTWNDGAADETLTDTDVNSWVAVYDYQKMMNKCIVYGMRIGDRQLSSNYSDAASIAKYIATRTKVEQDTGLVSEYDTLARATALVNQHSGVQMMLSCTIAGNALTAAHAKTLALGYEIQVTSTYLGLTNAWYIVNAIDYDSKQHLTTVQLHPRVSATGLQRPELTSAENAMQSYRRGGKADKYIPAPGSNIL